MTREPGKPGEPEEPERRPRYLVAGKDEGSYMGSPSGHQGAHARPGASLRTSVTTFCHGWQGKPAGDSDRGWGCSPSEHGRVVGEPGQSRGRVSQALRAGRDEAVLIHALGFALVGILGRR